MKMLFRSISLLMMVLAAACGGGDGASTSVIGDRDTGQTLQMPAAATIVAARPASSCSFDQLYVTVQSVRLRVQERTGKAWHEVRLPAPRQLDLLRLNTGVLEALRAAPLPTGRYLEVRLMLASDPTAHAVQPSGGALVPLGVPGGARNGLKLTGDFDVPPWQSADVVLDGFNPCTSVVQAGGSGAYQLMPEIPGRVALLAADQEHRINGQEVAALPGGGVAAFTRDANGATVQRYGSEGSFAGGEIRVASSVFPTSLTPLAGGAYLLTWQLPPTEGPGLPTQPNRFMLQLYNADGTPLVAAYHPGLVYPIWFSHTFPGTVPTTAALTGGGFALLWRDLCCHYLLRHGSGGGPFESPQTVDLASPARVIALASGRFMVVSGLTSISARVYGADGAAVGSAQFVGATQWSGVSTWSDFAASQLATGGAVVVWATEVSRFSGATPTLNVRRVAGDGSPIGDALIVGNVDIGPPSVAGLEDGGFVVSWQLQGHVYAARFAADGSPAGGVTRIDAITSSPTDVSVVPTGMGGFLVSWSGIGADGQRARYGRLFGPDGLLA